MEYADTFNRGLLPSIVERFEIVNLHGYRTLTLLCPHAATVLIAQNGAGKTTLLNALDAFLKCQFLRLRDMNFTEIRCRLTGHATDLVVRKDDIQSLTEHVIESEVGAFAKKIQTDPRQLVNFLSNNFGILKEDIYSITDDPIFEAAVRTFDYNQRSALDYLEKLQSSIFAINANITDVVSTIRTSLRGIEVLYLPTYRRIENPLAQAEDRVYRRGRPRFKIPFSTFSGDVQFGLSDISDRLSDLNREILLQSNKGYRKLSADIIKELLDGSFARAEVSDFYLPSTDDLNLFFSRLKDGQRVGPFVDVVIPDIEQLVNVDSPQSETNRFLLYFISKLNSVLDATRGIENQVADFISRCNNYLSSTDIGYGGTGDTEYSGQDSKELRLNRADLSVYAVSLPSERKIALDALSSGEKQMISLLAKLYLYPRQKIVLIDEPELSLSIDWQKQILVDIVNAPACNQLVAITHSPFVFDNELDPFAKSLKISVDQARIPPFEGDEHEGDSV
ncbi:AAA family ATPase [Mesorhizobium sp. B2-7-1]|uniref:AAA family ATPase n=1 Tax=Mesorhizobium sp. B2-7-1 TaxID=2589909 RepID=UPI0015E41E98|nr:AAA family ATPase [Mesorhizobium sp. B2-7-1]